MVLPNPTNLDDDPKKRNLSALTFDRMVVARDDVDYVLRWLRQTGAPENIVGLQLRALETLGGCGCDYELVEDGAVQRLRWFHEPGCPRG